MFLLSSFLLLLVFMGGAEGFTYMLRVGDDTPSSGRGNDIEKSSLSSSESMPLKEMQFYKKGSLLRKPWSPITSLPSSSSHAMGMGSTKIFRTRVKHKASSSEERERTKRPFSYSSDVSVDPKEEHEETNEPKEPELEDVSVDEGENMAQQEEDGKEEEEEEEEAEDKFDDGEDVAAAAVGGDSPVESLKDIMSAIMKMSLFDEEDFEQQEEQEREEEEISKEQNIVGPGQELHYDFVIEETDGGKGEVEEVDRNGGESSAFSFDPGLESNGEEFQQVPERTPPSSFPSLSAMLNQFLKNRDQIQHSNSVGNNWQYSDDDDDDRDDDDDVETSEKKGDGFTFEETLPQPQPPPPRPETPAPQIINRISAPPPSASVFSQPFNGATCPSHCQCSCPSTQPVPLQAKNPIDRLSGGTFTSVSVPMPPSSSSNTLFPCARTAGYQLELALKFCGNRASTEETNQLRWK